MTNIDIVIPVYNEGRGLENHLAVIREAVTAIPGEDFHFIIVNDGSTDDTLEHLHRIRPAYESMDFISLTRHFGKEAAILAGLEHSQGKAVVVMDSDLQHPPELIKNMVALWKEGILVIEACKRSRGREGVVKGVLTKLFFRAYKLLVGRDITNHSDYKLLDRRVADYYCALPERKRFFRGLVSWMGFSSASIYFDVPERQEGIGVWTPLGLSRLSIDALTGFTSAPLYVINILGGICFVLSLAIGGLALYHKFIGVAVSGLTTVILLILLIGSFIMFGLGLIGVYIGQIFTEVKNRPIYLMDEQKDGGLARDHNAEPKPK